MFPVGVPGPELRYNDAPLVAGQAGTWTPIGAETDGNRLRGRLDLPGGDQYHGLEHRQRRQLHFRHAPAASRGTATDLEPLGFIFHQDLNGDGTIGVPDNRDPFPWIDQPSGNYRQLLLLSESEAVHRALSCKYNDAPFVAGQAGTWTPIGAEQTGSGGYEVAWTVPGSNQFTVWNTDSNGNFVSDTLGVVGAGNSLTLEQASS